MRGVTSYDLNVTHLFLKISFIFNIYLAEWRLRCGTWDLRRVMWDVSLWYMDSLVVAHGLQSVQAQ